MPNEHILLSKHVQFVSQRFDHRAVSKVIRIVLPSSGLCQIFLSGMAERVQTRKII